MENSVVYRARSDSLLSNPLGKLASFPEPGLKIADAAVLDQSQSPPTPKNRQHEIPGGVQFGTGEPLSIDPSSAGLAKQLRSVDQDPVRAAPGMPID